MRLSISQLEHFHERGYLVVKGLIPLDEVRASASELDGVHEAAAVAEDRDGRLPWKRSGVSWDVTMPEGGPQRIEQLMHSDDVSPALARIGRSSAVVDVLDQLMDPDQDLLLFHSKTLMRAADASSRFPWHQDFGYWVHNSPRPLHLNCAVAIDPQTVEAGCLMYVEGSQKRGLAEHQHFDEQRRTVSSFDRALSDDLGAYRGTPVEYEPGDALFFGSLVIHGSDINRTGRDARFNTFAYNLSGNNHNLEWQDPVVRERDQRLQRMMQSAR